MHTLRYLFSIQIICIFALNTIAQPTQEWFTSHNGSGPESHGHFILTCDDGGFLQIGETGYIPSSAKIYVVKTDANGNLLWEKEFGTAGHNLGNSAYELSDGYLICGALNQNSALIKLNKTNGNTIFSKTYNNGGSDALEHIAETTSGFLAVGYVNALDPNNTFYTEGEGYLTFIDAAGNKTSGSNINTYTSHAYRIKEFGGELFVSGLSAGAEEYNLMKFDFSGNIIWDKTFGGSSDDHCFGMDINATGEIFLTGHTISGIQNWDTYTMKISSSGNLIWEKKTGNPRGFDPLYIHDEAWGIKATADGGCLVVAGTGDEYSSYSSCNANGCSDVWRVYLIKYDASGTVEWQETYFTNNSIDWAGEDVDLTADGGAIVSVDDGTFGFLKIVPFAGVLPVELTDFQAEKNGENAALLTWETAAEINFSHFEIEYSSDGTTWFYLNEMAATGNVNQGSSYTYTDETAAEKSNSDGTLYYRLKMIDLDGEFAFSQIRSVSFDLSNIFSERAFDKIICYPNPVESQVTIANVPAFSNYRIFSVRGILEKEGVLERGGNLLDLSELEDGVYFVLIENGGEGGRFSLVKD